MIRQSRPVNSATAEPPPDLPFAPCTCGHDFEAHDEDGVVTADGEIVSPCEICDCDNYEEKTPDEPDYSREQDYA